ncbi:MAG: M48 family metallopeptidase [Planctomycetia bacterium]|nr:M48 family metallopeptidase [Planctomycetia bacterium]
MTRWAARLMAIGAMLIAAQAFAQGQNLGDGPFIPKGFGSPDELFEKMFGQSTAEEEKALQAIPIPIDEECEFGRPQVETFLTNLQQQRVRLIRKGKDLDYVRKLVETIRPLMKDPKRYPQLTIYVVDSPRVDARSFPGGTLFFFKGLLSFAENEAAVAGIVGHELSHLDRGHLLLPLKRAKLMQQATGAGGFDPQKFFAAGTTMMRLSARPFRPEDESAADRDGAKWAWQAGYDPREMARLFDSLHQRDRDPKLPFGAMFRTHPYSDDRRDAILKHYDELQQKDPRDTLYRGKENLALRIPKSQQEFPE